MTFIEVFLSAFGGSITGSLTTYFLQRYAYKKGLDKLFDKIDKHIVNLIWRKKE